ncbi:hypothetical protein ACHAQA_005096 [Verticillium albo-atrum]
MSHTPLPDFGIDQGKPHEQEEYMLDEAPSAEDEFSAGWTAAQYLNQYDAGHERSESSEGLGDSALDNMFAL